MEYQLNQLVVYPSHGVANVKRIEQKLIGGVYKTFYVLHVLASQMSIIVPVAEANKHIRPISTDAFAKAVIEFIEHGKVKDLDNSSWNRRYREFMETLKAGELLEVAKVYKQLLNIKGKKDLSFGERKMLDHAKSLLVQELSASLGHKEDDVYIQLSTISA